MQANLYALGAIAMWSLLALLGVALKHVPPFLLTGAALILGSLLALPHVLRQPQLWRIKPKPLALGVLSLFGFHFLLFIALRMAPAVEVNLINYLWPLLMVVLAPLYLPAVTLRPLHYLAALLGFSGAAVAILGARTAATDQFVNAGWGVALAYLLALCSAFIWANFSLQTKRMAQVGQHIPTAAIGLFGLLAGLLALLCHFLLEPAVQLSQQDYWLLALTGLGPLGAAFFLWDKALKLGDARQIGLLSYLTPLGSTALLMLFGGRSLSWSVGLAATMIVGAALLGSRVQKH